MQLSEMLDNMKTIIPADDLPIILASLREDEHIWQCVQEDELFRRVIKFCGPSTELWNPWVYTVLFMEDKGLSRNILSNDAEELPKKIIKVSFDKYQRVFTHSEIPENFEDQALISISLRERRKRLGSWRGIGQELLNDYLGKDVLPASIWSTILAINFAMAKDRPEFINALFEANDLFTSFDWAIHCVCCVPQHNSKRVTDLLPVLRELILDDQLACLRRLIDQDHENLAISLGIALTDGLPAIDESKIMTNGRSIQEILNQAEQNRKIGSLYQIAGKTGEADLFFSEAKKGIDLVSDGINLQASKGNIQKSILSTDQFMTWLGSSDAKAGKENTKNGFNSFPYSYFEIRNLMKSDLFEEAKQLASSSFQRMISAMVSQPQLLSDVNAHIHPAEIIETYLELGLNEEANQAAEIISSLRPNDISILLLKSQASLRIHNLDQAEDALDLAISLNPKNPECHRKFADLLSMQGKWKNALIYRKQIINLLMPDSIEDILDCASCAINAEEFSQAEDACEWALKISVDNPIAYAYLGKIRQIAKDYPQAHDLLLKATLIKPDLEMAWINLSNLYYETGQTDKARETLRSAVLGCPESADVAFALAEQYLSDGMVTDALPYLKKASEMHLEKPNVSLRLIQALRLLGRLPEALEIVVESRQKWPIDPELAFQHGEMLIESGSCKLALEPLEVALATRRDNPHWNVLYGYALLDSNQDIVISDGARIDHEVLNQARSFIQKVHVTFPDDFEVNYLMAEIFRLSGEPQESLKIYRVLVDKPFGKSEYWNWRIQTGMGQAALLTDNTDIALAALSDASLICPNNPYIQKLLAKTYLKADLPNEAANVAENLNAQFPDDEATLSWFIDILETAEKKEKIIKVLGDSLVRNPENSKMLIRLAAYQIESSQYENAEVSLGKLEGFERITSTDLEQAADLYLDMGKEKESLACYEKAVEIAIEPSEKLLFKTAALYEKKQDNKKAVETLSRLAEINLTDYVPNLLLADLLVRENRLANATELLNKVNSCIAINPESKLKMQYGLNDRLLSERWKKLTDSLAGYYDLAADLLILKCDYSAALPMIEKVIAYYPKSYRHYLLKNEILALSENGEDQKVVFDFTTIDPNEEGLDQSDRRAISTLFAIQAEINLVKNEDELAEELYKRGIGIDQNNPRLQAIGVRISSRKGLTKLAIEDFEKLTDTISSVGSVADCDLLSRKDIWIAAAALEAGQWNEAVTLLERFVHQNPGDAIGQIQMSSSCVQIAEASYLYEELKARSHGPNISLVELEEKFSASILQAGRLSRSSNVDRWKARGYAVFQPSPQAIRSFALMMPTAEDTTALVAALRRLNNIKAAIDVARRYPNNPSTLIQQGFCYIDTDPAQGLTLVIQGAEKEPYNPIHLASVAMLAERNHQEDLGLDALESALKIWPDEPEWEVWAANLACLLNNGMVSIQHYEKALKLQPKRADIGFRLGKEYANQGMLVEAGRVLDVSIELDDHNVDAAAANADVNIKLGNFDKALSMAKLVGNLNPKSVRSILLIGEISLLQNRLTAASEYAKVAMQMDPGDIKTVLFGAKVEKALGNSISAIDLLNSYLSANPACYPVVIEKARINFDLDGPEKAYQTLKPIVDMDIREMDALQFIAKIQSLCGETRSAIRTAQKASFLHPEDSGMHMLIGGLMKSSGDLDQAIYHFSEAVKYSSDNMDAMIELAEIYATRRENQLAIKTLESAAKINPSDPRPYIRVAFLLRDSKDYPAAETMLRRAAQISPDDLDIRRHLGAIIALNLVHHSQEASTVQ